MWGLGVLGWGFVRGGVRVLDLSGPRAAGRLPGLDAYVFEGGPSVLRWVPRLLGLALVARLSLAGLSTCMMWRGRRGGGGPGPGLVVLACASLSRRVLLFEWLHDVGSL